MLTLSLNGNVIPVPVNFSMRLTIKNPFCFFDKIPASYSIDFSLPINDYTTAIFGHPERFTKHRFEKNQKFEGFQVIVDGSVLMAGTIEITAVSDSNLEFDLYDLVGTLGDKEQDRSILDIAKFSEAITWDNRSNYSPADSRYCCFPVINASFFKDKGVTADRTVYVYENGDLVSTDEKETIWVFTYLFNKSTSTTVNKTNANGTIKQLPSEIVISTLTQKGNTYETGDVTVISPFFYLGYVISEALKANDFYLIDNILATDATLKKLCIYNNFDITATDFLYGDVYNVVHHESADAIYDNRQYVGKSISGYDRSYQQTFKPVNHLPNMRIGDALLSTQNLFNIFFHFKQNNTVNSYSREDILIGSSIDLNKFFLGRWKKGAQKTVALKFIRENDSNDLVFSERFNDLSDRIEDIKPAVADWPALQALVDPAEGEIRYVISSGVFAELKWFTQTGTDPVTKKETTVDALGWEEISIGLQPGYYLYGRDEEEEIRTSWSTLLGKIYNAVPYTLTNQPGNMNGWKATKQSFSPRLLIQNVGTSGGSELNDFSFEYEKATTGIIEKYWKHTAPFWANRLQVTGKFDLPVNILRHVIDNIFRKFRTIEGEFIIEELNVDLYVDHIGETEIKGYKVE